MTEGAKNGKYSVRQRDLGRNLYIDDGWGNEGWLMDSQVERIK